MKRLVPLLALALALTLPLGAAARTKHAAASPGPAAAAGSVSCAGGDPVVWVNTETKVYHLPGSAYYGKTKHGKYACASDAAKLGAHAAKRESGGSASRAAGSSGGTMGGAASGAAGGDADGSATAGTTGKHHRHHKGGASPLPSPGPM